MKYQKHLLLLVLAAIATNVFAQSSVNVTVNLSTEHQTIRGFGGMNHTGWISDLTQSQRETAFGNEPHQLGLTVLRMFIDDQTTNWPRDRATAKWASDNGILVFASPWNPPSSMRQTMGNDPKANHGAGGNWYRLNPARYADYVKHLNDFIKNMYDNGVNLYAVSVQNEPDYGIVHGWAEWNAAEVLAFMKDHAGNIDPRVKVISPEPFQYEGWNLNDPRPILDGILNDPAALANTDIIATHLYGTPLNRFAYPLFKQKGAGKELWMTEVYRPNSSADGNTWPEALDVAEHIHNALVVGEFQMYVWWYIRRYYGFIHDGDNGGTGPQAAAAGTITKRGWMMAHFSKFVRPGAARVAATDKPSTNVFVSAYKNADGKVAIVAINKGTSASNLNFTVSGASGLATMEAWRTSSNQNMQKQTSDIVVTNGAFTASLPAQSVTTFVGSGGQETGVRGQVTEKVKVKTKVLVRGRVLSVSSPNNNNDVLTIRMIDVRGKVVARYNVGANGNSPVNLSLTNIPAGRYFVDVRGAGVKQTLPVVVK